MAESKPHARRPRPRGRWPKLVTLAKRGDLHARRQAAAFVRGPEAVRHLFDYWAGLYGDRQGGYTRILRGGFRPETARRSLCWSSSDRTVEPRRRPGRARRRPPSRRAEAITARYAIALAALLAPSALAAQPAPARGSQGAILEIIEFSDFECPYCAQARPVIDSLLSAHPDDVRYVFRHFPLPNHAHAARAAQAALEAQRQESSGPTTNFCSKTRRPWRTPIW